MSRSILIVGAGPAGAAVALAALEYPDTTVTMIDIGGGLEDWREDARSRLARVEPAGWRASDLNAVQEPPVPSTGRGLPEKRSFGSDYPFRDLGQTAGIFASDGTNTRVVSSACGGFSNVWGAQVIPFTDATLAAWPIDAGSMTPHYRRILQELPYAAESDDLADLFAVHDGASPLPELNERSSRTLARYERHRDRLRASGVVVGKARLAMASSQCARIAMCMTGCPYHNIYSARQTIDHLRRDRKITYYGGLMAVRLDERDDTAVVVTKELATGRLQEFTADRVFVACGAIGSTRLVLGSLELYDKPATVSEAAQFVLPFFSARGVEPARPHDDFTLNQFNMALKLDSSGREVPFLHFYTFNRAFVDALPAVLRHPGAATPRRELLRRLCVALGYLPSWASPSFDMVATSAGRNSLPDIRLRAQQRPPAFHAMVRRVLKRLVVSAPALDLWPLVPLLRFSAPGKSYHWGGTFPHMRSPATRFGSDLFGRVAPWRRIHLADAAVFPDVPATTFTLTIMANAHRLTTTSLAHL